MAQSVSFVLAAVLCCIAVQAAYACTAMPRLHAAYSSLEAFLPLRRQEDIRAALPSLRAAQRPLTTQQLTIELAAIGRPEALPLARSYALRLGATWRIGRDGAIWQLRGYTTSAGFQAEHAAMRSLITGACPVEPVDAAPSPNEDLREDIPPLALGAAALGLLLGTAWFTRRRRFGGKTKGADPHPLHACQFPTRLRVGNLDLDVTSSGLSRSGLAIRYAFGLTKGRDVTVEFAGLRRKAHVIWCREDVCGLHFKRRLGRAELASLLARNGDAAPIARLRRRRAPAQNRPNAKKKGARIDAF